MTGVHPVVQGKTLYVTRLDDQGKPTGERVAVEGVFSEIEYSKNRIEEVALPTELKRFSMEITLVDFDFDLLRIAFGGWPTGYVRPLCIDGHAYRRKIRARVKRGQR